MVRVGRLYGMSDEEIITGLAGMLAECDGHNYGNNAESPRIWDAADFAKRIEKDPEKVAAMLRRSLPLADKRTDGTPYVGRDWASIGIYQQIPSGIYTWGWGTVEDIMDPAKSAGKFWDAYRRTSQASGEPLYYRVQKVQGSQYDGKVLPFADNYRVRMTTARAMFNNPRFFTEGGISVIDR